MKICDIVNGIGVIFHMPKLNIDEFIKPLLDIYKLLSKNNINSFLILENKATIPDTETTYETPERFNLIVESLLKNKINLNKIALCIDTAHLHASGIKLHSYNNAMEWLSKIDYPYCIKLFHLNGSNSTNHKDIHAVAFGKNDYIWKNIKYKESGFKAFMDFAKKYEIDIIFENNIENEKDDFDNLLKLIKRNSK